MAKVMEMKARILGVAAQMGKFDFYFEVSLGEMIFQHCDNLSRTLQIGDISAAEGQQIATMTCKTLVGVRSESKFDLFCTKVYREPQTHTSSEPQLPRNGASASVDHRGALKGTIDESVLRL